MTLLAAQETPARLSGSLFLSVETTARLFGGLIAGFGDSERLSEITGPLSRGEIIGAIAVSEAEEGGSTPDSGASAVLDGDEYILSGRKSFVTNSPIADWIAVVGRANDKPAAFLVRPDQPGVHVGPRLKTLGYNGLAVASMELNRVRTPARLVLGPFDDDAPLAYLRSMQDLILTVGSVGLMQSAVNTAKDHSMSRRRGGREIYKYQEVRFKLAEMLTLFQTAQLLAYRAAWQSSQANPDAATTLNCAKVFVAEAAEQVSIMAMQIMAGSGYISGNPVERAYREAKFAGVAGVSCEVGRMLIADDQLRRYRV
jgi:alkylation response protein AidB-like acyl-CoA dehydrogenase